MKRPHQKPRARLSTPPQALVVTIHLRATWTGMRIIRAVVAGERNPDVLATYRDVRCHSSTETIRAALVGNDREEHVFALRQSLELYDVYQAKMRTATASSKP